MDALILDKNWEVVAILDAFQSFIWTDRFLGYGDFEVYVPADMPIGKESKQDYFLWCREKPVRLIVSKNNDS